MTDYKQLCAELTAALDNLNCNYNVPNQSALVERALAALAEPEPESPTDEDLEPSSIQIGQLQSGLDHCFSKASAKEYLRVWVRDYARAVLARWGR